MPFELKTPTARSRAQDTALRRRVQDEPSRQFTGREIDQRLNAQARRPVFLTEPVTAPGAVIESHSWREFLKDSRMYASLLAEETDIIETEIRQAAKTFFSTLDDLQREVYGLDALINEDEVRGYTGFNNIHFNKWIRSQDQPLDYDGGGWLVDFKTKSTFLPSNIAEVIPGVGLGLPVRALSKSLVQNISLLKEETEYGDTRSPIVSGNPMDLLDPTRVFRHIVVRREFDNTSRSYQQESSTMALLIELSGRQLINYLSVRPLGHSPVEIQSLSYYDEDGTEQSLPFDPGRPGLFTTLLFEPVRTRFIKLKFVQHSPVAKTQVYSEDPRIREINTILRGQGFSQLLSENPETVQGRVYDFSLQEVEVGLREYTSLGIYRSGKIDIKSPVGIELHSNVSAVTIDGATVGESDQPMPEGSTNPEMYLGIDMQLAGVSVIDALVPVPHHSTQENERIALIGQDGYLRFIPDVSDPAKPSFVLYMNDTTLFVGTDYHISLDGGSTWLTSWATASTVLAAREPFLLAGEAMVRILDLDRSAFYHARYTPFAQQSVIAGGAITLMGGRLSVSSAFLGTVGTIQVVTVIRSVSHNPYLTPVVDSYLLKVREDVT